MIYRKTITIKVKEEDGEEKKRKKKKMKTHTHKHIKIPWVLQLLLQLLNSLQAAASKVSR